MEMRRLGKTELSVARIGFGGMTLVQVADDQAEATVSRALDIGVNFVDTARAYGNGDSEQKIGRVLQKRRNEVILSSRSPEMGYDGMKKAIDKSLQALPDGFRERHDPLRASPYCGPARGPHLAV